MLENKSQEAFSEVWCAHVHVISRFLFIQRIICAIGRIEKKKKQWYGVHYDAKFIFLLRINNLSNLEILNIDNQFFGWIVSAK